MQSIKQECLDTMLVFGEKHLRHIVGDYADYYNTERLHQVRNNRPPVGEEVPEFREPGVIECRERLGGLLKHYRRAG